MTEREETLAMRKGYKQRCDEQSLTVALAPRIDCAEQAKSAFPLKPRQYKTSYGTTYSVVDNKLMLVTDGRVTSDASLTVADIKALYDLVTNPE